MSVYSITGAELKDMVFVAAAYLEKNKKAIDSLNVFPVPDGDTGTNMSMTMHTAAKEVRESQGDTVAQVAAAIAMGSLKGARGNSGVILSQIFRGFSAGLSGQSEMDPRAFADGMKAAVDAAYKAVMRPKEGTILTVAKAMAAAAEKEANQPSFLVSLEAVIKQGEKTLAQTPELLPVLKEAGVVDSGGTGLIIVFKGFKMFLEGEEVPEEDILDLGAAVKVAPEENQELEYGYCTEFFVKNPEGKITDADAQRLRSALEKIGDCAIVVGDSKLLKIHVHTNAPGKALQYGMRFGALSSIKVDNMREQHRSSAEGAETEAESLHGKAEKKEYALVAVASGEGLKKIFADLYVDKVIEGGQSMNPSIEELSSAIEAVPSDNVFVFPNNKNIILAATQAAQLSNKRVEIISTRSIPQGITGIIAFSPEDTFEENVKNINEAIEEVDSGAVTYAVRDTSINGNEVHEGDIIGVFNGDVVLSGESPKDVAIKLLEKIVDDDDGTISIFYGKDVAKKDAEELAKEAQEKFGDSEVQLYEGGQPLYFYIMGIE